MFALTLAIGFLTPAAAAPSDQQPAPDTTGSAGQPALFSRTVPVRPGDRCIVCGTPLQSGDKVYLLEGQRVCVMTEMEPTLFEDPWAYIARLKPRGGLFGGETAPGQSPSDVWLLLGIYVTFGLAFAAVCAHRAVNTGRNAVPWFLGGLLLNALAYLALLLRSAGEPQTPAEYSGLVKIPATAAPQPCEACGALNHPGARTCSRCGTGLTPRTDSEAERVRGRSG
jgi:hypothetical protein